MTREELAKTIEHTLLRATATPADHRKLCEEAVDNGFAAVCVNPDFVAIAAERLAGSDVAVATVIGFPLGASCTDIKASEAHRAVADGATELDMMMAIGRYRAGERDAVKADIDAVVGATDRKATVKVILETAFLTGDQLEDACELVLATGAKFVKTSTGFGPRGATVDDIKRIRAAVGDRLAIKAAGGIRDAKMARRLLEAGADRIGTSQALTILDEWG